MKNHLQIKKLTLTALFTAVAVVGSMFSFPVLGSKCAPVQHLVNVLCAVTVGPWWGLRCANNFILYKCEKRPPRISAAVFTIFVTSLLFYSLRHAQILRHQCLDRGYWR